MTAFHPISDPLDILLTHDAWASREIVRVCSALTPEQFTREFPMGFGTLQKTLAHMASAMYRWGDVLAGGSARAMLDPGAYPSPSGFLPEFARASELLRVQALARPLSDTVDRDLGGTVYRFTRGVALLQITTHGTYHRAQCVNMLRQLGVAPVPDPSVMKWAMALGVG